MGDFKLVDIGLSLFSVSLEFTIKAVRKIPSIPHWIFVGSMLATALANMKSFPFHSHLQAIKNYLEENWLDFFLEFDGIFLWCFGILFLLLILMAIDTWMRCHDEYILGGKPNYLLEQAGLYFTAFYLYISLHYINLLIIATSNFAELHLLLENNSSVGLAGLGACVFLFFSGVDLCSKVGRV